MVGGRTWLTALPLFVVLGRFTAEPTVIEVPPSRRTAPCGGSSSGGTATSTASRRSRATSVRSAQAAEAAPRRNREWQLRHSDIKRTSFEDLCQLIRDDYEKNGRDADHLDTVLNRLRSSFAELLHRNHYRQDLGIPGATEARRRPPTRHHQSRMAALKLPSLAHFAQGAWPAFLISTCWTRTTRARASLSRPVRNAVDAFAGIPAFRVLRVAYITGWRVKSELLSTSVAPRRL